LRIRKWIAWQVFKFMLWLEYRQEILLIDKAWKKIRNLGEYKNNELRQSTLKTVVSGKKIAALIIYSKQKTDARKLLYEHVNKLVAKKQSAEVDARVVH